MPTPMFDLHAWIATGSSQDRPTQADKIIGAEHRSPREARRRGLVMVTQAGRIGDPRPCSDAFEEPFAVGQAADVNSILYVLSFTERPPIKRFFRKHRIFFLRGSFGVGLPPRLRRGTIRFAASQTRLGGPGPPPPGAGQGGYLSQFGVSQK